jgi:hypothetical protein
MKKILLGLFILLGFNVHADFTNMPIMVGCSSPKGFLNPTRIHVLVKKSADGRLFAHVERRTWWGTELRAHAEVKRQASNEARVPAAFTGEGVQLVVTDTRVNVKDPSYFNNTYGEFAAQVLFFDIKLEMNLQQALLCSFDASY